MSKQYTSSTLHVSQDVEAYSIDGRTMDLYVALLVTSLFAAIPEVASEKSKGT